MVSKHITMAEATNSETAKKLGISNLMSSQTWSALVYLLLLDTNQIRIFLRTK